MSEIEEYQSVDETLDTLDQQQEYQDELLDSLQESVPQRKKELGLFQLFLDVIRMKDSTKVAFARRDEVGPFNLSIRGNQHMAHLCERFNHQKLSAYFKKEGEIILSTTMGRDGNLAELFVSQKKFSTRARKSLSDAAEKKKWKLFGPKTTSPESE